MSSEVTTWWCVEVTSTGIFDMKSVRVVGEDDAIVYLENGHVLTKTFCGRAVRPTKAEALDVVIKQDIASVRLYNKQIAGIRKTIEKIKARAKLAAVLRKKARQSGE